MEEGEPQKKDEGKERERSGQDGCWRMRFAVSVNPPPARFLGKATRPLILSASHKRDAPTSSSEVVRTFYTAINARDLSSVQHLIAHNCVYEDLVFPRPFVGRKAILEFFDKFTDSTSTDLQFVIDDISPGDSSAVGVTWHLEWKGRPFPFSKGCSFYRLTLIDGRRQIVYGRDCVEPAIKPGKAVLAVIKGVTWLLLRFPRLADQLRNE